jgi:hypothetical protein
MVEISNFFLMKTLLLSALVLSTFSTAFSAPAPVVTTGAGGYVQGVCYPFVTLDVFYSMKFTMLDAIANQNTCKAK